MSDEKLGSILLQAKCASKNIRAQRDLLLQFQLQLQPDHPAASDAAALQEIKSGLVKTFFYAGLEAGARYLTIAAKSGARLALTPSFAVIPDEQLYDALLAQRLPARPTTQTEAFSRVEAALFAVKLAQEHHLLRCVECLAEICRPDNAPAASGVTPASAKVVPSSDPASGEPPQEAGGGSMERARAYLDRGLTLVNLAVKHVELAAATMSRFLDPKKVAELSDFADKHGIIT